MDRVISVVKVENEQYANRSPETNRVAAARGESCSQRSSAWRRAL